MTIDPADVGRSRGDLPPGYEVADAGGRLAPVALWGLGEQWVAEPAQCAALADPPVDSATVRGWSASGPGGIVFAVAAAAPAGLDESLREQCATFSVLAGHTTGSVKVVDGPVIDGVVAVGLHTDATTVVEGGTETHSRSDTFTAYLGEALTYVTVVTDPGSSVAPLGADFAAELLASTVSALRGSGPSGG